MLVANSIRDGARRLLNEITPSFWLATDITDWVSQAAYDISTRTLCVEDTDSVTIVANIQNYTPTKTFLRIQNVYYINGGISLRRITPIMQGYQTAKPSGPPELYYDFAMQLWIVPKPTLAEQGGIMTLFLAVESGDITKIPTRYYFPAVLFVTMSALIKERQYTKALQLYNLYMASITVDVQNILIPRLNVPALDEYSIKQTNTVAQPVGSQGG